MPFVAPLRYTESGMRVRAMWERTWDLQRREDRGEKVGAIPVPPKYKQGDFRDPAYWRSRGKLDVPKERFISYPGASRDGTLLLGWAGWDHLEQAQALTAYITERRELDAWDSARLKPLLAGLAELLPWVKQWHPDVDPDFGVRPGDAYDGFLGEQCLQLGLTRDDLAAWWPEAPRPAARWREGIGSGEHGHDADQRTHQCARGGPSGRLRAGAFPGHQPHGPHRRRLRGDARTGGPVR